MLSEILLAEQCGVSLTGNGRYDDLSVGLHDQIRIAFYQSGIELFQPLHQYLPGLGRQKNHPQGATPSHPHECFGRFDFRGVVEREDQCVVSLADDLPEHGVQGIGKDVQ